jgi:hypothetical protein
MKRSIDKVNDLDQANQKLKIAIDEIDRDRAIQISKLQDKERQLLDRLHKLEEEKFQTATVNGNVDISNDDLLEINAGGKIIAVKRGTLTQMHGSRIEAMFSGRWDKKLIRDGSGRIFLDVNGDCFQAIVDYLNEAAISSEDEPPERPCVDDELQHILEHQLNLFGLDTIILDIESNIIKKHADVNLLHKWLKEDESDGGFEILYRSSRDGLRGQSFHSKCDNNGRTITIIETNNGGIVGGYTDAAWVSKTYGDYLHANKAFLFAVSGFGLSSPCKLKMKNNSSATAIYCQTIHGPTFGGGHDLLVNGSTVTFNTGSTYNSCTNINGKYKIKEMEVFRVTDEDPTKKLPQNIFTCDSAMEVAPVSKFSKEVNDAINNKMTTLNELETEVLSLEESFKDEEGFIESFGSGDTSNVIMLNVSGTMMATSRATLLLCEESVLAQQFDDSKWTEQGSAAAVSRVKDWTPEEVTNWVKGIKDIPDDVATLFQENEIKGSELIALNQDGLKMMGVKRVGTICLLLKEIKQLEEASQDTATLIEYSPYCFGKILDYLRLKRLHTLGLLINNDDQPPALPIVCESQKKRFEKVVKYYFPGESSKFILG